MTTAPGDQPSVASDRLVLHLQASPNARNEDFVHVKRELLKQHWNEAMEVIGNLLDDKRLQQQKKEEWLDRLIDMHQEEGRYYHTAVHLEEILGYLDIIVHDAELSQQPKVERWHVAVLILATFFHDAVYDTHSSTNEEDSAKLFQTFFQDVLSQTVHGDNDDHNDVPPALQTIHSMVVQLILATKRHEIPSRKNTDPEDDQDRMTHWLFATFLDLDMAVLGKEPHAYLAYANLIRHEYHWVERKVYCETRANILQGFLDRDGKASATIYLSPDLQPAWEERAKDNLRAEVALLRQGNIPGEHQDDEE